MLKTIFLFPFLISALAAQNPNMDTVPSIRMSSEYNSSTGTIKTVLRSFKDWVIQGIENHQDEIQQAIDRQGFLVISDIGCFDGSNFFEPLKEVIVKIRELFGQNFKIKVIYSDLSTTPGEFTKGILNTPEALGADVQTSYQEHNFYHPLPYLSNITLCTLGTHWLSTSPSSSVSLFPTCFKSDTFEKSEVSQIADADLETFLRARLQDTSIFLGLVNMIKLKKEGGKISFSAQATMQFMDDIAFGIDGIKKGVIPFYYRFPEEFLNMANAVGYHIDRAQNFIFPCDYVQLFKEGIITREKLALCETKMARAWSEGSITAIVGKDRSEEFYDKLHRSFEISPESCGSDYHLQFLTLSPSLR